MIEYENHLGLVDLSKDYFFDLVSAAVFSCFGVAGMSDKRLEDQLLDAFASKNHRRGISIHVKDNSLLVNLHIRVLYGVNLSAIVKSIINKVTYQVESATSIKVHQVNVFVDDLVEEE